MPLAHIIVMTALDDITRHNVFNNQRTASFVQSETTAGKPTLAPSEQTKFYFLANWSPSSRHLYYLSINDHVADQGGLTKEIDKTAAPLVVIGSPCQPEIRET